ncbi:MAG TPA: hypothetical protein VGQ17_03085 [Gemmatimonadales bacterium]|jgi:hypothetical protein|nr:hypothetical protein [Gemmatimonadales bacterium]
MPAIASSPRARAAAVWLAAGLAGCNNAGESLGVTIQKTSAVSVLVYLDRDGSHTPSSLDTAFAGARVALLNHGSQDTLRTAATVSTGIARFDAVPVGQYTIAVAPSSIGDSIQVAAIDSTNVRITAADTNRGVIVRLAYPEVSIRQARALPIGRRVFVHGLILAGVQSFRDTTSHLADSSGQIRMTRVSLRGGLAGNNPGDSVSVLGGTSTRAGQPTLDLAVVSTFANRLAPVPFDVSTAIAATAAGGVLDAALVRVTGARMSDTATVSPDFVIHASDGSGTLTIVIDPTLNLSRTLFRPGDRITTRGVLVPDGAGGWVLKPRFGGDIVLN